MSGGSGGQGVSSKAGMIAKKKMEMGIGSEIIVRKKGELCRS